MEHEFGIRHCCSFRAQKHGNSPEEFEDASAVDTAGGRFAVADGATECSFAEIWAKQLVRGFVSIDAYGALTAGNDAWSSWLPPLQREWADIVDAKDLPWFGKNKVQKGAHATFLGLTFSREKGPWRTWRALAVGDACMFIVRNDQCEETFPISHAEDFSNSPSLVASLSIYSASLSAREHRREGTCCEGDRFWLMTDALAHWFLKQREAEQKPWHQMEPFLFREPSQSAFAAWVQELRETSQLRNDDVTLVGIGL